MAVVILNSTHITDRTIILSCKNLGIHVIYLAHGSLIREEYIDKSIDAFNKSFKGIRLKKAFGHFGTIINFLYSTFKYDKRKFITPHPYRVLLNTFINPGGYMFFPPPSYDLMPDLTLVYGKDDREFFKKRQDVSKIKIIGNPELDNYFLQLDSISQERDEFLDSLNLPKGKKYIVYIEEGTVEEKLWSNETRLNFINQIKLVCEEVDLHLVVKLHPRAAKGPNFNSIKSIEGITVLADVNFPKLINFSEKCVSHYSTTLIYAMLLGKPILVPRWGNSKQLYKANSANEVTFVYSLSEFKEYLLNRNCHYDRQAYLDNYVPFRDGKTSIRIAQYILNLIN